MLGRRKEDEMNYDCHECYDTGCSCGGIGLTRHGCCTSCHRGKESRERRVEALCDLISDITEEQRKQIYDLVVNQGVI
jgi:hypothetical protein